MKKIALTCFCVSLTLFACKSTKETAKIETPKPPLDCSSQGLTFADIKPIFDKNCISCHGYGGSDGLNFLTSADVKKAASKGELLGAIKHQKGFPKMPAKADQLDQASIDKIECWINNGMKD